MHFHRNPLSPCLKAPVPHLRDRSSAFILRHMKTHTTRICLAMVAVLVSGSTGCALPVIEGIFDRRDFAIFDDTPEARGQSDDEVLLVFLELEGEGDSERLRTVSVDLRAISSLPVGEAIAVGDGSFSDERPNVEVVEGSVVREQVANGTLISTGDDAKRAMSIDGSITLEQNDDDGSVAGTFRVDLDDGGYLEGRFASGT
jgi:hypothetical protein